MHVGYCQTCLPTKTVVARGDKPHALVALLHSDHDPLGATATFVLTDDEWDAVKDEADVASAIVGLYGDRFV